MLTRKTRKALAEASRAARKAEMSVRNEADSTNHNKTEFIRGSWGEALCEAHRYEYSDSLSESHVYEEA